MKKLLFLSAVTAGLMTVSCSQDEPVAPIDGARNQINFTVTADGGSRAASSFMNGTDINEITVSAWVLDKDKANDLPGYTYPNTGNAIYFLNDVLTRQNGEGTFNYATGARFWPMNGETLDFFAVVGNTAAGWGGKVNFSFNCDGKPGLDGKITQLGIADMPDLLYAYTPNAKLTNMHTAQQNVALRFNHAFAKVVVTAEVKNPNLRVCITEASICGLINEGKFYLPYKSGESTNIVENKAAWVIDSNDPKTTEVAISNADYNVDKPIVLDMNESAKGKLIGGGAVKDDLLVLPYNYNGRNASKYQTYIKLKGYAYNIAGDEYDDETDRLIYPATGDQKNPVPAVMIIPIEFDWKMGTINHYNIVFDCGNGGSTTENPNNPAFIRIGYEVEVNPWTPENNPDTEYKL